MKTRLYTPDVKLVLVASFFFLMSPMLINPVIAGFAHGIGASSVLAGVIAGLTNLTSLVLRPLAGNLTDPGVEVPVDFYWGLSVTIS